MRTIDAERRGRESESPPGSLATMPLATVVLLVSSVLFPIAVAPASAAGCAKAENLMACENARPSNSPSAWDIDGPDRFFDTPHRVGTLTTVATTNGQYLFPSGGGYPNKGRLQANYFVDVIFTTAK
jgi:hypothetical protein